MLFLSNEIVHVKNISKLVVNKVESILGLAYF